MPSLYLVFSAPPEGVTPVEYDRWYHAHIRENLAAPGFVGGQRFAVTPAVAKGEPTTAAQPPRAVRVRG